MQNNFLTHARFRDILKKKGNQMNYSIKNIRGLFHFREGYKTLDTFVSKEVAFNEILQMWRMEKIGAKAACQFLKEVISRDDIMYASTDSIEITLLKETMDVYKEYLEVAVEIEAGTKPPQYVPCKNCGAHGAIVTKNCLIQVDSQMEGFAYTQIMNMDGKIEIYEMTDINQQILNSNTPRYPSYGNVVSTFGHFGPLMVKIQSGSQN